MTSLIDRLEKAGEGSRELDSEIALRTGWARVSDKDDPIYTRRETLWWYAPGDDPKEVTGLYLPPSFSRSLDAALALAERVLPDVFFELSCHSIICGKKQYGATLWPEDLEDGRDGSHGHSESPALALCIAVLKAHTQPEGGQTNV